MSYPPDSHGQREIGDGGKPKKWGRRKKITTLIGIGIAAIIIAMLVTASIKTVNSGFVGIKTTWGEAANEALGPGLHFVNPISDNVITTPIQVLKEQQTAAAASKDLQDVQTIAVVNYRIDPNEAVTIFKTLSLTYPDRIIDPKISEIVKSVSAKYTASQLITQREEVRRSIQEQLTNSLKPYNILVEGVAITNFAFSPEFTKTIEGTVVAQQQLITQQNQLAKVKIDAQQRIAVANATKTANILEAQGQAQAKVINAQGESSAIQQVQKSLLNAPDYISYLKVKTWNGQLPLLSGNNGGNILSLPPELLKTAPVNTNATK